jgi:hypothetical protein
MGRSSAYAITGKEENMADVTLAPSPLKTAGTAVAAADKARDAATGRGGD